MYFDFDSVVEKLSVGLRPAYICGKGDDADTRGEPGFVYAIGSDEVPARVKIGKSIHPEKRLVSLQSGSPVSLRILATVPVADMMSAERALHRALHPLRLHNEWFRVAHVDASRLISIAPAIAATCLDLDWEDERARKECHETWDGIAVFRRTLDAIAERLALYIRGRHDRRRRYVALAIAARVYFDSINQRRTKSGTSVVHLCRPSLDLLRFGKFETVCNTYRRAISEDETCIYSRRVDRSLCVACDRLERNSWVIQSIGRTVDVHDHWESWVDFWAARGLVFLRRQRWADRAP